MFRSAQELARRIARVSVEAKLELDEESYVGQFKPAMMDVVNAWCQGSSFAELCKMTDAFEGTVCVCHGLLYLHVLIMVAWYGSIVPGSMRSYVANSCYVSAILLWWSILHSVDRC